MFELLGGDVSNRDLVRLPGTRGQTFACKYPEPTFWSRGIDQLPVWHLVGGLDPIAPRSNWTASEPEDGYPVLLRDWIRRDGLNCLKIKLRGTDAEWDFDRLLTAIGEICDRKRASIG